MSKKLAGKIALVTVASKGIGAAIAKQLSWMTGETFYITGGRR